MANNISIAIIGLSLNITNQVKNILKSVVNNQYIINWTNIADNKLNLLIIGDNFTDSPAIQRINIKNLKTLIIHHNNYKSDRIELNHVYMPLHNHKLLFDWLEANIFTQINYVETLKEKTDNTTLQLEDIYSCLTQNIHQYYLCTINNAQYFVIDKKQQEIWVSSEFYIDELQTLNINQLSFNEFINHRKQTKMYDLNVWLWNFLWKTFKHTPTIQGNYYKLLKWPQPLETHKNCLKLSACFQYGAHIEYVQDYTKLELTFIQKFIYISKICNMVTEIAETNARFKIEHTSKSQSQIKNFFSKIRKKLGL